MKYVKTQTERGEPAARLDISDLDLEVSEAQQQFLTMSMVKYQNPTTNGLSGWNKSFQLVNQFFDTLDKYTKEQIAKCIMIIHMDTMNYVSDSNQRAKELSDFITEEGQLLIDLDNKTDILTKLEDFVKSGSIVLEKQTKAGSRPQDKEWLTWRWEQMCTLVAMILFCKMVSPLFSVMLTHFNILPQFDTDVDTLYVSNLVTPVFDNRFHEIMIKLYWLIEHHITKDYAKDDITKKVMTGYTRQSLVEKVVRAIVVRPFVNIDLGRKNNNPVTYLHTVVQKTMGPQQLKSDPWTIRDPNRFSEEEDNTGTLEYDSTVTDKTMDIPVIAKTFAPLIVRRSAYSYDITDEELNQCHEFYMANPFPLTFLAHSLTAGFFGPRLGGGSAVTDVNFSRFVEMVTVVQLICIVERLQTLGHLLTARQAIRSGEALTPEETQLQFHTDASDEYRNCAARYTCMPEDTWHNTIKHNVIGNVLAHDHYYNTAPLVWSFFDENRNGQKISVQRTLAREIASFVETHI